jgi:hypothetical protein
MTGQPEQDAQPEPAPDLEYDLAHEGQAAGRESGPRRDEPVYVATTTEGFDGDYGYDLAHDVPGR